MARGLTIVIVYLGSLAAILFGAAGRLDWPLGWAVLGVYAAISILAVLLVDPALVRERSELRPGVMVSDALLAAGSFLFFLPGTLLVAGLDAGRFAGSPPLPLALRGVAFGLFTAGNLFGLWAMVTNPFFSTFVRIQKDRAHRVVSNGPYALVRHPGYAGSSLASLLLPLALGSLWALLPAVIGVCGFMLRTAREDWTLQQELPGYREYAARVRHRLVPGVW